LGYYRRNFDLGKNTMATERFAPVKRALISVSDKTGVVAFARTLRELQIDILSTGGTA